MIPILLLQTRGLGFAPQGGPLYFIKHLLLALSSEAVASSPYLSQAACLTSPAFGSHSTYFVAWAFSCLLVQWNMGFVFQFFPLFVVISYVTAKKQKKKCQLYSTIFKP